MGVRNLWDILESCKKTLPLHHLQNKKVCVDLSCWLVQFHAANRSPACVKEKLYLRNLFHRIRALIALNCSLIFVTDGAIPSIKLSTYRRRLGSSSEAAREEGNSQPIPSLRRNKGSEFSCMMKEAKVLGMALGIPCLDGIEEAEAQCALLNSSSLCDGCFTSDSDIFLFGARTVFRDIIIGEGGYVICYEMADIERKLGFGRNSLISLAVLLGSDYSNGVHGFGPETACRFVKSIGDDSILHHILSDGIKATRKSKGKNNAEEFFGRDVNKADGICLKSSNSEIGQSLDSDGQFLEVINAYLEPKCHSPDSEAVQRVCTQYPFLRSELQQICEQCFGWSPEKTDQYILPKIAERDLRRFSNLRSTSLALGIKPLLKEIPVPCPVSAIVKERKVQGSEYYEVSWRNIDGLRVSVVPGDLVRSACPEKIAEFIEKKDEKKKQKRKPRPKKTTKASVNDADLHLQGLLLSIESENNKPSVLANCPPAADIQNAAPNNDTIDLSSPSPPVRAHKHAKCQKLIESTEAVGNDVGLQLQGLLLSAESESSTLSDVTNCTRTDDTENVKPGSEIIDLCSPAPALGACRLVNRPKLIESTKAARNDVDLQHQGLLVSIESQSSTLSDITNCPPIDDIQNVEPRNGTIDLSSPAPAVVTCELGNCPKFIESTKAAGNDVEMQHQNLLLSTESRSNTLTDVTNCPRTDAVQTGKPGDDTIDLSSPASALSALKLLQCPKFIESAKAAGNDADLQPQNLSFCIEPRSSALSDITNCSRTVGVQNDAADHETIDLSSPFPPLRDCKLAKCQKLVDQHADVIDVCESENDVSPEHGKKATELRLFINSIRDDLY